METLVKSYNLPARVMHWLSALCIIGLSAVDLWMFDLSYYSESYRTAPHYHRSVGILLAILTVGRIVWKHVTASPKVE
ncbi:cytochrome b/b6 domain-containing protein, partial [Escherichia coli]|nr:cytochrome b/b6 domain-containing protein [Escherichia coli]